MKRVPKKNKPTAADEFTFAEKIACIYIGLYVVREHLSFLINSAFLRKKISLKKKKGWESFFAAEFDSCLKMNISFDRKEPWQGYTIPMENVLFPVFKQS